MPCFSQSLPAQSGGQVDDLLFAHPFVAGARYQPRELPELVTAVIRARNQNRSLRAHGSNWSLSRVGVADDVVDTSVLNLHVSKPYPAGANEVGNARLRDGGSNFLHVALSGHPLGAGRRYVHVEAGIKIRQLLEDLSRCGMSLPTMGDGAGQSLIGAISTGTHGADLYEPPLVEWIRAVHLVSASGREFWITPTNSPFANPTTVMTLPHWCADARFVADDTVFAAARLGVGRIGVVYSVILEVVEQYTLIEVNVEDRWSELRTMLTASRMSVTGPTGVFNAAIQDFDSGWVRDAILKRVVYEMPDARFRYKYGPERFQFVPEYYDRHPQVYRQLLFDLQLTDLADDLRAGPMMPLQDINIAIALPSPDRCFVRRRWKRLQPVRPHRVEPIIDDDLAAAVKANKTNPPGIVNALKDRLQINPFKNFFGWLFHDDQKKRLDYYLDGEIARIAQQHLAIRATSGEALFMVMHRMGNEPLLRDEVSAAAADVIAGTFSRTARAGPASGAVYQNMLDAHDYGIDGAQAGSSAEFHFDAATDGYLQFVDAVIGVTLRRRPILGYVGIRFTPAASALIAMQQYALTASVEISTLRSRLEDVYAGFWGEVHDLARMHRGIPHWGQEIRHSKSELESLYGRRMLRWRSVLDDLVDGEPQVMRTDFSVEKGLEPERSVTSSTDDEDDIDYFFMGLNAGTD